MRQVIITVCTVIGGYLLLYVLEFAWKLLFCAPVALDRERAEEIARQREEIVKLQAQLEPKLEILFEPRYPYQDDRSAKPGVPPYRLFRIGVRAIGIRTVGDIKVVIEDIDPRPEYLFTPLLMQAIHDRSDSKTTELHPSDEPWYWDVVEQRADGSIHLVHTTGDQRGDLPEGKYKVKIRAAGRDVPSGPRWFVISLPTPRQGKQDLQFAPAE